MKILTSNLKTIALCALCAVLPLGIYVAVVPGVPNPHSHSDTALHYDCVTCTSAITNHIAGVISASASKKESPHEAAPPK